MALSQPVVSHELRQLAGAVRPVALSGERVLPVLAPLQPLLPEPGLRRGSVVAVSGTAGATSLALALLAAASIQGSWCVAVGVGGVPLGFPAAAELGIALERFPAVSAASGNGPGGWAWVVATLLDAVDIIVTWPPSHVRAADARRLAARGRERGAVVVLAGASAGWPAPVDVELRVSEVEWHGIGQGHGRLQARSMVVVAGGRGAAARGRRAELFLPAASVVCNPSVVRMAELASITTL